MKRLIAAVTLAVLAAPVIAADRGLPYEQTQFDRGVSTQNVADNASSGSSNATGVWSNDYNFIAPAQ